MISTLTLGLDRDDPLKMILNYWIKIVPTDGQRIIILIHQTINNQYINYQYMMYQNIMYQYIMYQYIMYQYIMYQDIL